MDILCSKYRTKKDGLQSICIDCKKEYNKDHYQKNKKQYVERAKKSKEKFRKWYNEFKSGLACSCGESHVACLTFHHRNPEQKEFTVSQMVSLGSKKKILKEIEKCDVLCFNCHAKQHYRGMV